MKSKNIEAYYFAGNSMNAMIERKYCSISTSYLAGLFDIFDIKSHLTELCVF